MTRRNSRQTSDTGVWAVLGGAALGAGLMYVLDPERGRRRRALMRDKADHAMHVGRTTARKAVADLENRSQGVRAEIRNRTTVREIVPDEVLEQRVRAALGRYVTHPGALDVTAQDGVVVVSGPILEHEAEGVMRHVRRVRGVLEARDHLDRHVSGAGVPALQGPGKELRKPLLLQEHWPPGIRLAAGATAGSLTLYGSRRGGLIGTLLTASGLGMLLRAVANLPLQRFFGLSPEPEAIDLHKTLHLDAPVEAVYRFFEELENLPRFMSHVASVERRDQDVWHWEARGPAGMMLGWDARVTRREPNHLIAWKSLPESPVHNAGFIRFEPTDDGGTRLNVQMSYNPPAGALGHAVASLFGADPKHAMDEDMLRLKSLLEEGKATARGDEVERQHVERVH